MIWASIYNDNTNIEFVETLQELKDIFEKSEISKNITFEDFKNNGFQHYNEENNSLTEVYFNIEELIELEDSIETD